MVWGGICDGLGLSGGGGGSVMVWGGICDSLVVVDL